MTDKTIYPDAPASGLIQQSPLLPAITPVSSSAGKPTEYGKFKRAQFIRGQINALALLSNVSELMSWLVLGYRPVYRKPETYQTPIPYVHASGPGQPNTLMPQSAVHPRAEIIEWIEMDSATLSCYRAVIDAHLKLLSKVLPDLKAVEVTEDREERKLSDLELANRLASILHGRKH